MRILWSCKCPTSWLFSQKTRSGSRHCFQIDGAVKDGNDFQPGLTAMFFLLGHFRALCIFFSLVLPPVILAQGASAPFEPLGVEHGLPSNVVTCLLQDRQGFLWLGTRDGLARYDGHTFQVYKHDPGDSTTISCNWISTLYEDRAGVIGVGASGYLLKKSTAAKIVESIREADEGGAPMNPQIARKVLTMFAKMVAPQAEYALTRREKDILNLLVSGLSQKMIAGQLHLSFHTITTHMKNIYTKLHVHSRSEAVAKALKERLI